jgi:hypothetical protein
MARLSNKFNPLLKTYPESEKINSVSEGAEVLYVRLLAASDDAGRFYGDAGWVLSKLFTARALNGELDKPEIERRLCELESCKPSPLIKRYWVGSARYLELVGVMKSLRGDVSPQIIFPEQLTENGTACPGLVPPTQPQPNPTTTLTSTSTSTTDVGGAVADVDGRNFQSKEGTSPGPTQVTSTDWASFDWESLIEPCQAMAERFPAKCKPLSPENREEILKVQALLATSAIEREWVDAAITKARRRSTDRPFAAFHGTLRKLCEQSGLHLNRMFSEIGSVPVKLRRAEATP